MTVVLTAASTALPSFAPSVGKGSFRFRTRYRATSTAAWVTWYRVVRVQRDADGSNLDVVAPALEEVPSETAEARGYATIFDDVVRNSRHLAHCIIVAGQKETDAMGYVVIGAREFDPANFAQLNGVIAFKGVLAATPGMTAQVLLWNKSDSVAVPGAAFATTANVPTPFAITLAVPANLPNSSKMYEVHLRISAGVPGPDDRAMCFYAAIEVALA